MPKHSPIMMKVNILLCELSPTRIWVTCCHCRLGVVVLMARNGGLPPHHIVAQSRPLGKLCRRGSLHAEGYIMPNLPAFATAWAKETLSSLIRATFR